MKCAQPVNRGIPLTDWANEVEQIFDRFLGKPLANAPQHSKENYVPTLDIAESDQEYLVHVDLPGVKSEDVKLEIHEDRLTISGKRDFVQKKEGTNYHRIERSAGEFFRTVVLPSTVDHDKISADFVDGVLEVRLPKLQKSQPRKIEIKTNPSN